ncbi:uncharacterized protein LOC144554009 [Carex rostrata]
MGTHQPETSNNYTEEQVRVVREIRKNKDYYAILGVEKNSSAEEIKRAYKKLSLKIHPDKNRAPGAEEAFKSVLEAYNYLSNEQSRRNDDQTEQSSYDQTEQSRRNDDQTRSENYSYTRRIVKWVAVVSLVVAVVVGDWVGRRRKSKLESKRGHKYINKILSELLEDFSNF